jgi:inosine-uridine nucleoside N-ribohydrolase
MSMKLIIETDIGHDPDDFFALCYFFSAGIDIKTILITPGDESQIAIVDFLLQMLGKTNIPIGVPQLGRRKELPTNIHKALLDKYHFPHFSTNAVLSKDILDSLFKSHADLEFFGCGPLKNFGNYKVLELSRATMQGGFIGYETHNISVKKIDKFIGKERIATFNLNGDKQGAHNFLNMNIKDRRFVGKNVCHYMIYNSEIHKLIMSTPPKDRASELLREGMDLRFKLGCGGNKYHEKKFHDPTAAVCHLHPEIGTWVKAKPYCEKGEWGAKLDDQGDSILIAIDEEKVWDYIAKGE